MADVPAFPVADFAHVHPQPADPYFLFAKKLSRTDLPRLYFLGGRAKSWLKSLPLRIQDQIDVGKTVHLHIVNGPSTEVKVSYKSKRIYFIDGWGTVAADHFYQDQLVRVWVDQFGDQLAFYVRGYGKDDAAAAGAGEGEN